MNIRASLISGVALFGAALSASAVAATETAGAPPSITVSYEDLNPANKKDAEQLYLRLQSATRRVCVANSVAQRNRVASPCYRRVLAKAVSDVNAPEVAALHSRSLLGGPSAGKIAQSGSVSMGASK